MQLVWPWWQRLMHWALALCIVVALVSHEGGRVHETAGYFALAVAGTRILLGFVGPLEARFSSFLRGPSETWTFARAWFAAREPRFINHNPLGGWMVAALLSCAAVSGITGWLYTTDRFWGYAWLINLHAIFAWAFIALVPLHVMGVLVGSRRHRENLVAGMLHGRKRSE